MKSEWSKVSLAFLFLVALIGTILRSTAYFDIPFNYQNLVHAHSHTAFQGWVYLSMFLLLTKTFLTDDQIVSGKYALQFIITVLVVVGVMVSFSLQGYGLYSIIFSTLFQILNYWFIFRFLRDSASSNKNSLSLKFIKVGLGYGVLSTILPFAIGITSAKGLSGTELYTSLIYSFLHLQYNGWFSLVVIGLFYNYLDRKGMPYDMKKAARFFWLYALIVIPAISLSLLGMNYADYVKPIAYLSSIFIGLGLINFIGSLPRKFWSLKVGDSTWFKCFLFIFLGSFILKCLLQILSVLPYFMRHAFFNKPIVIAYLHLTLIGSITMLFLALFLEKGWLGLNKLVKTGSTLFMMGFFLTEIMLVLSGLGLFQSQVLLLVGSASIGLGVLFLILQNNSLLAKRKPFRNNP